MRRVLLLGLIFCSIPLVAQDFVNPDLLDNITGSSIVPWGWQSVPETDPACEGGHSTPDCTSSTEPNLAEGLAGVPYSGPTFVSGLRTDWHHEGIMQTVSGFVIGETYNLHFYQSVVKQSNARDKSGGWIVYIDSLVLDTSDYSYSDLAYNDTSLIWNERSMVFTAQNTFHTFKFMPFDDDTIFNGSFDDTLASLRMGIDLIHIYCGAYIDLGDDTVVCEGDTLQLSLSSDSTSSIVWQDGSTENSYEITESGTYWVNVVDTTGCTMGDTISVNVIDCLSGRDELGDDVSIYPNPITDQFVIEGINKSYDLTIYDALGRIVFYEDTVNESKKVIDATLFNSGLLIVMLEAEGEILFRRILKQ